MNFIKTIFFKMHPLLKSHILFYANGLAIYHGLPSNGHVTVNIGRYAAIFNFIDLKFLKMHPLLKPLNLLYSNGVAILSGFHDIPKNLSVGFILML